MPNHLLQQSIFERLRFAIAPALLLCANLVLFGSFAVFVGNPGEFLVTYREALALLLLPASVIFIGLVLLATLLGPNRGQLYNALIIFLAVVTYIHGSLLLWRSQAWPCATDSGWSCTGGSYARYCCYSN